MFTLPTSGGLSACPHTTTPRSARRLPRRRFVAVAAASVLLLSACAGTSDHGDGHGTGSAASAAATGATGTASAASSAADTQADDTHNDADIAFAQGMIVHHRGALEMASLAVDRAGSDAVRQLADRIQAAQTPEIDLMTGWLQTWSAPVPTGSQMDSDDESMDHGSMDHQAMSMMSAQDMSALSGASGSDFDRRFLELMIVHHEGAVAMSQTELTDGQAADALTLARSIIDSQTAEITEMRGLLASA